MIPKTWTGTQNDSEETSSARHLETSCDPSISKGSKEQRFILARILWRLVWSSPRTISVACWDEATSNLSRELFRPTIGDVREINKVVRTLKSQYVDGRFWPLKGSQRILGMPDASYRNNSDKSSQRAHVIFLAEDRKLPSKGTYRNSGYDKQAHRIDGSNSATRGSIIDYESHKITTTTQSTTVAELNALMKCFGTCLFLRALWADISGEIVPIHIRTDANNLVTTAQTTHLPEQKETHHLAKFRGSGGVWLKKGQQGEKRILGFQLQGWMPACQQVKHTVSSTKLGCFGAENGILKLKKANLRHFWAKII